MQESAAKFCQNTAWVHLRHSPCIGIDVSSRNIYRLHLLSNPTYIGSSVTPSIWCTHQFNAHNLKHTSVDVFCNQGKSLSIAKPVSLYEPHGNVRVEWVPGWNESYFSTFENNNYCIKFLDDLRNIWLKWRKWLRYLSAARINICFPPSHLICPHHIFVKCIFLYFLTIC